MLIRTVRRSRIAAFTLVEVVLALGVIAISLVGIFATFPGALNANRGAISDTRAAQIAHHLASTIDGQCDNFSGVWVAGNTLNLTKLTVTDPTMTFYASYPSGNSQPYISNVAQKDSIYTVELRFDNNPTLNSSGTTLGTGKLNQIQIRVKAKNGGTFTEYFYLARNRS
jgi:uncharacterized protein (TIGR02598 family)